MSQIGDDSGAWALDKRLVHRQLEDHGKAIDELERRLNDHEVKVAVLSAKLLVYITIAGTLAAAAATAAVNVGFKALSS